MFEAAEQTPDRIDVLRRLVPRVAISLFFLSVGSEKFTETGWLSTFEEIGVGDWFRRFTGALQVFGAFLLLIPRTALLGAATLGTTMAGAILAWVFVLRSPGAAIFPAIILGLLVGIALGTRPARSNHRS